MHIAGRVLADFTLKNYLVLDTLDMYLCIPILFAVRIRVSIAIKLFNINQK